MKIRKYKNGNFAVKREPDYDSPIDDEGFGRGLNLVFDLVNSAELDFELAGEEGCAGNFDMYYPLYNAYTGLLYLILGADCARYASGEWVHIYGRKLDKSDIESLIEEGILTGECIRKFDIYQLDMWPDEDGDWRQNNQFRLGDIVLVEYQNLKLDVLKALKEQLKIDIDPHYVALDTAFAFDGGYEIIARKQRKPLFYLQEVR